MHIPPIRLQVGLLLATWAVGSVAAEQAAQLDVTPPDTSYVTRANKAGNRSVETSGAASFGFSRLDTNGDLRINRSEAAALEALSAQFNDVDSNNDFQITPSEFNAFEIHQMRAQQKQPQTAVTDGMTPAQPDTTSAPQGAVDADAAAPPGSGPD